MNRQRLQFVTAVFLNEMRRQSVKMGKDTTIKRLDQYPPAERSALMSAVEKAVQANDPARDQDFTRWLENQIKPETT